MTTYLERKEHRRQHFIRFIKGWRLVRCDACNGSGRFDNTGSPACGSCEGAGKVRVSPQQWAEWNAYRTANPSPYNDPYG
jgi:DnaJ-class molecular chaperone